MRYLMILITVFVLIFLLAACGMGNNTSPEASDSPFSVAAVGDTIQLGGFDWLVLDVQDDKALVISEKVLSQRQWHYEQRLLTWEPSDMRRYLNGPFFDNTFTEEEKAFIVETRVINNMNPWFGSAGIGADTMDRVFLLSLEEVVQYFGDSGMLSENAGRPASSISIAITDEYNLARIATAIDSDVVPWWWLRTPGRAVNSLVDASATIVTGGGDILPYGIYLVTEGGVRPALWVRICSG